MIKSVNKKLALRNVKVKARTLTIIREEPIKLAQYIRDGVFSFNPFFK